MKNTLKTIGYISIIPLIICIFFSENIWGYFKFKQYCAAHPQFIINEKLEPNVGWEHISNQEGHIRDVESKSIVAETLYFIPQIKFYRFKESEFPNTILDGHFIGSVRISHEDYEKIRDKRTESLPDDDLSNFSFEPPNFEEKTVYQLEEFKEFIPNNIRLSRMGYRVIDLRSNKTVIETSEVIYRNFDKEIYNYNDTCGSFESIITTAKQNQLFKNN